MRKIAFSAASLLLGACATDASYRKVSAHIQGFVGQPISVLVDRYGAPSSDKTDQFDRRLEWGGSTITAGRYIPSVTSTYGDVGGKPFHATTVGPGSYYTTSSRCVLVAVVDPRSQLVTGMAVSDGGGNGDACLQFGP